jgi:hypothetical protein
VQYVVSSHRFTQQYKLHNKENSASMQKNKNKTRLTCTNKTTT